VNSVKLSNDGIRVILPDGMKIIWVGGFRVDAFGNVIEETIPSQAAHEASSPGERRGRCNEQAVTKE
jgi:hypothetical protein